MFCRYIYMCANEAEKVYKTKAISSRIRYGTYPLLAISPSRRMLSTNSILLHGCAMVVTHSTILFATCVCRCKCNVVVEVGVAAIGGQRRRHQGTTTQYNSLTQYYYSCLPEDTFVSEGAVPSAYLLGMTMLFTVP